MAAVYNSVSKKQARQLAKEQDSAEEDMEMEDFLGPDDSSDSDEDEDEEEDEDALSSAKKQLAAGFMPKTRVLMLTSILRCFSGSSCSAKNGISQSSKVNAFLRRSIDALCFLSISSPNSNSEPFPSTTIKEHVKKKSFESLI